MNRVSLLEESVKFRSFSLLNGNKVRLYNQDCLAGMDLFPDKCFDVIVTSPPYNLGVSYGEYDDSIPRKEYLDWFERVARKIKLKMKDEGSFFLNVGSAPRNPWGPFQIALLLRDRLGFQLQNTIHWIKSIYIQNESYGENQSVNVGHYKPIAGTRFVNDNHEYIFHLTKDGNVSLDRLSIGVPYKDDGNISRWKNGSSGKRCRGNAWYVPYKTIRSRNRERPHPATFPIEIAEMCISLHGVKHDSTVLDPFMGIGNTSLASAKLGVSCVGFEIDAGYYDTNCDLLDSQMNGTLSSFSETGADPDEGSC